MKNENSYGIIPLKLLRGNWRVLLIQHHAGHWAFPKGHGESEESPQQTAERELQEETGLTIKRYLSPDPLTETYIFTFQGERVFKTVQYFLAIVGGRKKIQELEVKAIRWLPLSDAMNIISFKEGKRLCMQTIEFVKALDNRGQPLFASQKSIK